MTQGATHQLRPKGKSRPWAARGTDAQYATGAPPLSTCCRARRTGHAPSSSGSLLGAEGEVFAWPSISLSFCEPYRPPRLLNRVTAVTPRASADVAGSRVRQCSRRKSGQSTVKPFTSPVLFRIVIPSVIRAKVRGAAGRGLVKALHCLMSGRLTEPALQGLLSTGTKPPSKQAMVAEAFGWADAMVAGAAL